MEKCFLSNLKRTRSPHFQLQNLFLDFAWLTVQNTPFFYIILNFSCAAAQFTLRLKKAVSAPLPLWQVLIGCPSQAEDFNSSWAGLPSSLCREVVNLHKCALVHIAWRCVAVECWLAHKWVRNGRKHSNVYFSLFLTLGFTSPVQQQNKRSWHIFDNALI